MTFAALEIYPDWPQHAVRLRDAVVGLDTDQLALRAGPAHAPVWALAAHLAGARPSGCAACSASLAPSEPRSRRP
jgi:hypothetical protein